MTEEKKDNKTGIFRDTGKSRRDHSINEDKNKNNGGGSGRRDIANTPTGSGGPRKKTDSK